MNEQPQKRLHDDIGVVGLRAHATAVGLLALTSELRRAQILDDAAIGRIKDALIKELTLGRPRSAARDAFEAAVRRRLDLLFDECLSDDVEA